MPKSSNRIKRSGLESLLVVDYAYAPPRTAQDRLWKKQKRRGK
nr:MAG TPA: hypothetical protein [Caudoviricetes sp.]